MFESLGTSIRSPRPIEMKQQQILKLILLKIIRKFFNQQKKKKNQVHQW